METGPGAQAWARQLIEAGHAVRILPAQRVATHRSGPKNDRNDALAILRAGHDAKMVAVPVKSVQDLALQALHRVRQGHVRRRTALGNQMRGLLIEHDIALAKGDAALLRGVPKALDDPDTPLPDLLRQLLDDLLAEWRHIDHRIEALTAQLHAQAKEHARARQLMSVRGIGPIIASALLAKQIRPERFANARQFAAYFGIVPDQHSSGNKVRLGRMSKRGDGYVRSLLIEGAQSVLSHVPPQSPHGDAKRAANLPPRDGGKSPGSQIRGERHARMNPNRAKAIERLKDFVTGARRRANRC